MVGGIWVGAWEGVQRRVEWVNPFLVRATAAVDLCVCSFTAAIECSFSLEGFEVWNFLFFSMDIFSKEWLIDGMRLVAIRQIWLRLIWNSCLG